MCEDELDTLSTRLKMDFKKYVSQTVAALTALSSSKESFQYQLKKKAAKDSLEFVWKKYVPDEDITVRFTLNIYYFLINVPVYLFEPYKRAINNATTVFTSYHKNEYC